MTSRSLTVHTWTCRPAACARRTYDSVATRIGIWVQRTADRRSRATVARRGVPSRSAATPSGEVAMQTGRGSARRTAPSRRAENEVMQTRSHALARPSTSASGRTAGCPSRRC